MAVEYRLKPGQLSFIAPLGEKNAMRYARTTYPLKDCLFDPKFLLNMRHELFAGDIIHFTRFSSDKWEQTIEKCYFATVTNADSLGVELDLTFPIKTLNEAGEMGVTVGRGFAGQFVIRVDGTTYETRNTLVEAHERAEAIASEIGKEFKPYEPKTKKAA